MRTVCNVQGFDVQNIEIAAGRQADCFDIEAITKNNDVYVTIYDESDGTKVFEADNEDLIDVRKLSLADEGVYRIVLDQFKSDSGAGVSISYIDIPK